MFIFVMFPVMNFLSWIYWNPQKSIFTIPVVDHPVSWYGLFFAIGFICSYFISKKIFGKTFHENPNLLSKGVSLEEGVNLFTDSLLWFVVIGVIVGARLGHVFLYEWTLYRQLPWVEILYVWKGGLSSHGGVIGVLISLFLFKLYVRQKAPRFSFIALIDCLVIPASIIACFIRLGNFINQEICGKVTDLPWGVIFINPFEAVYGGVPRHPVQLYESLFYFFIFILTFLLWYFYRRNLREGFLSGLFFLLVFSFRFLIEFLKLPQSFFMGAGSFLLMGQYLSMPFILLGLFLLMRSVRNVKKNDGKGIE